MSGSLVALCADTTSLQHPESIGLAGENLAAQDWLRIFSSAEEARRFLRTDRLVDEVWVASSDDVAPINLAATLKRDRSDRCVCMLSFEDTGSLKSRMSATGIDASLTRQALAERYARRKQAFACPWPMAAPAAPRQAPMPAAMPVSVAPATAPQPARCDERRPGARAGFLFPVVSGSGGAGKSTVSVLSALIAQRMGYNTLLLDFDLQFGDAPALMGVQNPLAVDDVLAVPSRLDQLRSDGRMPALLAAPRHLEDSEAVVERAPQLLDQLTARFDVVVANTGAAWAEQHALLLERSSKALFLTACARPVCAVRHRDRPFPVRRQPMLQERPVHVHRRVMLAARGSRVRAQGRRRRGGGAAGRGASVRSAGVEERFVREPRARAVGRAAGR